MHTFSSVLSIVEYQNGIKSKSCHVKYQIALRPNVASHKAVEIQHTLVSNEDSYIL